MGRKLLLSIVGICSMTGFAEAGCYMCEVIKERNAKAPPPKHEYYDDYLKELREDGVPLPGEISFEDESDAKPEK
jgi:hypothetical protein